MRVNYSGELGAKQIYRGNYFGLKNENEKHKISEMLSSELVHLEYFEKTGKIQNIRPSFLNPVWSKMAFSFGFICGKLGNNFVMSSTYGVEKVIVEHYKKQLIEIEEIIYNIDKNHKYYNILKILHTNITNFVIDEESHRDSGHLHSNDNLSYKATAKISEKITKFAVFLSERV